VIAKLFHPLKRIFLGLTIINSSWLPALAGDILCSLSKPIRNNLGILMTIPKFGHEGWELPAIKAP
jgi:ATP-dependent RNA helicase DHX37/DHR1